MPTLTTLASDMRGLQRMISQPNIAVMELIKSVENFTDCWIEEVEQMAKQPPVPTWKPSSPPPELAGYEKFMDRSKAECIKNFKAGIVSDPINLDKYLDPVDTIMADITANLDSFIATCNQIQKEIENG